MEQQPDLIIVEILKLGKSEKWEELRLLLKEAKKSNNLTINYLTVALLVFFMQSFSRKIMKEEGIIIEKLITYIVDQITEFNNPDLVYKLLERCIAFYDKFIAFYDKNAHENYSYSLDKYHLDLFKYLYNKNERQLNNEQKRKIALKIFGGLNNEHDLMEFITEKTSRHWTDDIVFEILERYMGQFVNSYHGVYNDSHLVIPELDYVIRLLLENVPFLVYKIYAIPSPTLYGGSEVYSKVRTEFEQYTTLTLSRAKKFYCETRSPKQIQHLLNLNKKLFDIEVLFCDQKIYGIGEKISVKNVKNIYLENYLILIISNFIRSSEKTEFSTSMVSKIRNILLRFLSDGVTEEIFKKVVVLLNEENPKYALDTKSVLPLDISELISFVPEIQKFIKEKDLPNSEYKILRRYVLNFCNKTFEETIESVASNKIKSFISTLVYVSKNPLSNIVCEKNIGDPTTKQKINIYVAFDLPDFIIKNIIFQELVDDFPFSEFRYYSRDKVIDVMKRTVTKMFNDKKYKSQNNENESDRNNIIDFVLSKSQNMIEKSNNIIIPIITEASNDNIAVPSTNNKRQKDEEKMNIL